MLNVDNYREACSIPLENTVILTGGYFTPTTVSEYNTEGWVRDLAPLTHGRHGLDMPASASCRPVERG